MMNDQAIMENLLQTTKGVCGLYMHGTIESATQNVHSTFDTALNESLCMQDGIYKRMAQQGITLISDDDAVAELARDGFDPQYGARPLRRAIQNQVEDAVAELMLEGKLKSGDTAHVRLRDGKVVIDSEAVPAEAAPAAEAPAETAAVPAEK